MFRDFLRITSILSFITYISDECPKEELLNPCICNNDQNRITCGGSNSIELKTIFHRMSTNLTNEKKHSKQFYLTNIAIKEIPENSFEKITFEIIKIWNATNLSLIHTNAFKLMNSHLKAFQIINTSVKNCPPIHYIFPAISSMVNIESVFIGQTLIDEIPENAFRPLNGSQNNLTSLYFNGNKITK
jgi:hypothetical protein